MNYQNKHTVRNIDRLAEGEPYVSKVLSIEKREEGGER